MDTDLLLQAAVRQHQQGDLAGAAELYHQVLTIDSQSADAWNLLGVIAHQIGEDDDAIRNLRQAIALNQSAPDFQLNLAAALLSADRAAEAEQACRRCLELDPDSVSARNSLGNALRQLDRHDEAVDAFSDALTMEPESADVLCNAGSVLMSLGRFEIAENCLRNALDINPHFVPALTNLGSLYRRQGQFDASATCLIQALEIEPQSVETLINLGNTLRQSLHVSDAEECFRKALVLNPKSAQAYNLLGTLKQDTGDTAAALECFLQARVLDPGSASIGSNLLYCCNLCPQISRQQTFAEHRRWGQQFAGEREVRCSQAVSHDTDRRLRIGYVSPDFRQHPLVSFFEPMLVNRDRSQFEVICYAEVPCPDEVSQRLAIQADVWRSTCGLSNQQVAELIRQDEIDVLVDLAGHTGHNRLPVLAERPAPLSLSMLGYLETTGLESVDGYVTDVYRNPPGDERYYTETLIRLPGGGGCWQHPEQSPDVVEPPMLTNGFVTFGSTHRIDKLTNETLALWGDVLRAVPDSQLLIFRDVLGRSEDIRRQLKERCQTVGIDPSRVRLAWETNGSWLEIYQSIDVLLEAIPWGGGTTSFESMWMGVPVPALAGPNPFSRATFSVNARIGLPQLNALSTAEYTSIVETLAHDPKRLAGLRREFRSRMLHSVCDGQRFMREFESAVRGLLTDRGYAQLGGAPVEPASEIR